MNTQANTDLATTTLKGLKLNLTFSRETYCFTTKAYINGKDVAYAENDGNGGCTFVTLSAHGISLGLDRKVLEERIDALVHEAAKAKDLARILRKIHKDMTDKVLFLKAGDSGAYSYCKHNSTVEGAIATTERMKAKYPDATFLNGMSDAELVHILAL
jgi:hypothetical protein